MAMQSGRMPRLLAILLFVPLVLVVFYFALYLLGASGA